MGIEIKDFRHKISEALLRNIINKSEAFELILTYYSRYPGIKYPKYAGVIGSSEEKVNLVKETSFPYMIKEENALWIYSDESSKSLHEFLLKKYEGLYKRPELIKEERLILGDPECCAEEYAKYFADINRNGFGSHNFYLEIKKRFEEKLKILRKQKFQNSETLIELIRKGEIYPKELLYRGDMIPHNPECEKAIEICKERKEILSYNEKLIGIEEGYFPNLKEEIEKDKAFLDIAILNKIARNCKY